MGGLFGTGLHRRKVIEGAGMKRAGFSALELNSESFSVAQVLTRAGFSAQELEDAAFRPRR